MKKMFSGTGTDVDVEREVANIIKEDLLTKESRTLKTWRERWTVLSKNYLLTFKERRVYKKPTEVILLKSIIGTKTLDCPEDNIFCVETEEGVFVFKAESSAAKQAWIGSINSAMIKANHGLS